MNLTELIKKHPAVTCLTAGVIYSVQFWSDYTFIFAFPGLALYFFALFSAERKAFFRYSYAFCLGFFIPLYYWFMALYPFDGFNFTAAEGITIVIAACIGISVYHALLISAVMCLLRFAPKNKILLPLYFAALWTAGEWVLSLGDLAFSWGRVAIGQSSFLPMVESASLFGSYFIAFVVAAVSAYMGLWLMGGEKRFLYISASLLACHLVLGTVLTYMPYKAENKKSVALIQGNVTSADKWRPDFYDYIVETYMELCEEAVENGAEILYLPESPFPRFSSESCERLYPLIDLAKENNVTVLTGVLVADEDDNYYNSIVAIYPDGSLSQRYDKRHPVPFGETIPYGNLITGLVPALGNMNASEMLTAGNDSTVIEAAGYTFIPLVCFDSIFSSFSRDGVKNGGDIIFVGTNDSWYKSTRGVYEHMKFSVLRAIETGKPVIRSANTGISCIIDPRGNVISQTQPMVEAILYGESYSTDQTTLYTVIGDVWLYMSFGYIGFFIAKAIYTKHKTRKEGYMNEN